MQEKINKIIESLNPAEKDFLYRTLWTEYIAEDIETAILDGMDEPSEAEEKEVKKTAEKLAHQYCFDGDYDCNLCYWDNIENLIARENRGK